MTNAKFIGSLITNYIYQLTLHQAHLAPENRPFLPIYIDELGQFLKLPVDLEDALAVSRSMKSGLHSRQPAPDATATNSPYQYFE